MKIALKRPFAISFSKKNVVRPFEDAASLEFWAHKNDASMFVLGQSTKKRPNGLTIARMFDGKLLDMCELGVDQFVGMDAFKVCDHHFGCHFLHHKLIAMTCLDIKTTARAQAHATFRLGAL